MAAFTVHGSPFSPYVRAVLIALAEKGEEGVVQPTAPGGLRSEAHLKLHPFGLIPVLQHGDFTLYESQAILRYLDRLLPAPPLTPGDIRLAARMDQVMNITDHYLMQGVGRVIGFQRIVGPMLMGHVPDLDVIAEAMPRAHNVVRVLDAMLADQAFFAGDTLSLADILVVPHLNLLALTPEWAELSAAAPELLAWQARMNARPSLLKVNLPLPLPTR